jgi:hypothetical protein
MNAKRMLIHWLLLAFALLLLVLMLLWPVSAPADDQGGLEAKASIVFHQAENRMRTINSLLVATPGG